VVAPARGRHAAAQRPPPAGARRGARAARAAAGHLPTVFGHGRILLAGHGRPEQRGRGGIATILPRAGGTARPAARLSASPDPPYLCPHEPPALEAGMQPVGQRSLTERMKGAALLNIDVYEEVEADTSATAQAAIVVGF